MSIVNLSASGDRQEAWSNNVLPESEPARLTAAQVSARIERLPFSTWHIRLVAVVGTAHLLDAFDSLAIALALPVLIEVWHFTPVEIGLVLSIGYVGQMIGAIVMSWLAERFGRLRVLRVALGIMAGFSVAIAFAGGYVAFVILRFIQGLGLGGEVPVAATLVNEMTPARFRGRITSSLQSMFAVGILVTSVAAVWLIPLFGWRSMFFVGALPALLMCVIGWVVPESPRWLAFHGKTSEASAVLDRIEASISKNKAQPLPPIGPVVPIAIMKRGRFLDLFHNGYAKRTVCVWVIMFCVSAAGNGLVAWLPTIYKTAYNVTLTNTFHLSTVLAIAGLAGAVTSIVAIDSLGRRWTFMIALFGSAVPLAVLGLATQLSLVLIASLLTLGNYLIAIGLGSIHVYATEIYPTRMRALGAGTAMAWLRIAQIVSPLIIGVLLGSFGPTSVFLFLAVTAAIGGTMVSLAAMETKGQKLEDIST